VVVAVSELDVAYASDYSSSAVTVDSVPAAFFIKYALMN
jgi:hypothetical protein